MPFKSCPKCPRKVGPAVRTCACGHEFEKKVKVVKEPKAPKPTKSAPPAGISAKGRKECPSCSEWIGVRSAQCPECGHVFNQAVLDNKQARLEAKSSKTGGGGGRRKERKAYDKDRVLEEGDSGSDETPLKLKPIPKDRTDFPDPTFDDDPSLIPAGILEKFGVQEILKAMVQRRKGSQASYGSSHVATVEQFIEYLANHGYFFIRMRSRHNLGDSINIARKEWRELRRKYGIDRDPDAPSPFSPAARFNRMKRRTA